jgi:PPOX class probable F420-dependent enzyme
MPATFTAEQRELLDLPQTFARLATLMPDGSPQNTTIWYRRERDTLIMATPVKAQKMRNVQRDPRVAIVVGHPENPYHYVQIRGLAEVVGDNAQATEEYERIAPRYIGDKAPAWVKEFSSSPDFEEALIVVHPERVSVFIETEPGTSSADR